jgi:hypothetical protein
MKKTTMLFFICFLRICQLAAQEEKFTLSGYVRDAPSGEEVLGASVLAKGTHDGRPIGFLKGFTF